MPHSSKKSIFQISFAIWQFYLVSAAHNLCSTKLNSNELPSPNLQLRSLSSVMHALVYYWALRKQICRSTRLFQISSILDVPVVSLYTVNLCQGGNFLELALRIGKEVPWSDCSKPHINKTSSNIIIRMWPLFFSSDKVRYHFSPVFFKALRFFWSFFYPSETTYFYSTIC